MFTVALVTARAARGLDEDLAPLEGALRAVGVTVQIVDWDDETADWAAFDVALVRSPWDYTQRAPEFLAWAKHVSRQTRLWNPFAVIHWNTDKHYLSQLIQAGVPAVPSHFVELGEESATQLQRFFALYPDVAEFVVKPTIGGGARDAQRYERADVEAATAHAQRLLDVKRAALLQPYLNRVDSQGETALIYFEGEFSHAIRKGPLLRRGQGPTRALFAEEQITPRIPETDELEVAARTLAAVPFENPQLYARVDLIRDASGAPCLLELELTEPSLFFAAAPGAAERFAVAILARLKQSV